MTGMRRWSAGAVLSLPLVLTFGAPAGVEAQVKPRVVQAPGAGELLHVIDSGGRLVITEKGTSRELELPADTRIDALESTASGWIAAGHYAARSGGELLLLKSGADKIELLPVPAGRDGRLRGTPALFVDGDGPAGVAWLEGTRQEDLTVRAARWMGTEWSEPETVSLRGPGAQLALRGATLTDGSWLLVWAAVDGQDDDIWWSRRAQQAEGSWSPPRRLHTDNDAPDITPAVVSTAGGAIAAWSGYDGRDYRVKTSYFDGKKWSEPVTLDGRGATDARLLKRPKGQSLVYRTVIPAGWHVVDLDPQGKARRSAMVPGDRTDSPVLEWTADGRPHLDWPQRAFHWPEEAHTLEWERPR